MILIVFMAGAFLKSFPDERRQMVLHEALLRERIQQLLDEYDRNNPSAIELLELVEYVGGNTTPPENTDE